MVGTLSLKNKRWRDDLGGWWSPNQTNDDFIWQKKKLILFAFVFRREEKPLLFLFANSKTSFKLFLSLQGSLSLKPKKAVVLKPGWQKLTSKKEQKTKKKQINKKKLLLLMFFFVPAKVQNQKTKQRMLSSCEQKNNVWNKQKKKLPLQGFC